MRIFVLSNVVAMKTRLNLTIEESLLEKVKSYAASKSSSVSELVENYFKTLIEAPSAKRIADIIEELPKPTLRIKDDSNKADLKTQYMELF